MGTCMHSVGFRFDLVGKQRPEGKLEAIPLLLLHREATVQIHSFIPQRQVARGFRV